MSPDELVLPPPPNPTTRLWVDAYSMQLEAVAEIMADVKTRRNVEQAIKKAEADLNANTDPAQEQQLRAVVANQKQILLEMGLFNIEAYRELMTRWRFVRDQVLASGWDLSQELHFDVDEALGVAQVSQGTLKPRPFMAGEVQVILAFLTFVTNNQNRLDPLEYTKQILQKQGITAENFAEHAEHLCIRNPWAPDAPPPSKNIIQGSFR